MVKVCTRVARMPALLVALYVRVTIRMTFPAKVVRTVEQPEVGLIADRLQAVTDRALKRKGARILLAQVAIRVTTK